MGSGGDYVGVIFDGDHDFEGLRSPKAHLDTVLRNLLNHLGRPFTLYVSILVVLRVAPPPLPPCIAYIIVNHGCREENSTHVCTLLRFACALDRTESIVESVVTLARPPPPVP